MLGVAAVTPFSLVMRLVATATTFLAAAVGVLTPVATGIFAADDTARQQRLLIEGSKWAVALALYCFAVFVFLRTEPTLLVMLPPSDGSHHRRR